jgi:hypothetical protein
MTTLIATSVVRGSQQGDSHGGVYLLDTERQQVRQMLDWNTVDIDWQGRGWDRGLRGIAFANDKVYIAASDELFAYSSDFRLLGRWRSPFLKHCHEICVWADHLFLSSTAFDAILGFNLTTEQFDWALSLDTDGHQYQAGRFDPMGASGPMMLNKLHINNVFCDENGMHISGLKTAGMLHFNGERVNLSASLPAGTHNARPFNDGVLFNDTAANYVRFACRDERLDRAFKVPGQDANLLNDRDPGEKQLARAGFGRGLCPLNEHLVAAGSSPSTVSIHDLKSGDTVMQVQLSKDVRNAIHGLELWPYI